jgi:hypothetical protein
LVAYVFGDYSARQVPQNQILDGDQRELGSEPSAELVGVVASNVSNSVMQSGDD